MLFQILLDIIAFLFKYVLRILMVFGAIPFGIFMLLQKMFPDFCLDPGFWFWSVLSVLTIIAYIVLWKPILWIVGALSILGEGAQ